jgi:hypothetical protein
MIDITDLIDQDEIWIDGSGTEYDIAAMDPIHCANIVRFLTRRAPQIAAAETRAMLSVRMPDAHTQAFDDVDRGMDSEWRDMATDPVGWLNETPLMVALKVRAAEVTQ